MEALPIIDETVFEDAFWVVVLACEGGIEIQLCFLACVLVDLDVLNQFQLTEGAKRSGLSFPANPIFVFKEPTSIIRGMPYM